MEQGTGEERRFCTACERHVHDASKLTRREVEALLAARAAGERICFHLHVRRTDGAILLADGHAVPPRARVAGLAAIAAAATLAACASPQQTPPSSPHEVVEIPSQPPPVAPAPVAPAPVAEPPPIAVAEPEPAPVEEPPLAALPPSDPPPKPSATKPRAPVKTNPAAPAQMRKKTPVIYDIVDGGI